MMDREHFAEASTRIERHRDLRHFFISFPTAPGYSGPKKSLTFIV
jgi:hypothetical protein